VTYFFFAALFFPAFFFVDFFFARSAADERFTSCPCARE
jgi:hypothetical protein